MVICTGKDINRNTRPTNAGLKILHPRPPKLILPMPMATSAPIMIIHTGRFDGTLNASNTPVISAEPSQMVGWRFNMNFCITYSKKRQATTEVSVTIMAPMPKNSTEQINAGMSAMSTPYMFLSMESPLWICGEGDINNLSIVSNFQVYSFLPVSNHSTCASFAQTDVIQQGAGRRAGETA